MYKLKRFFLGVFFVSDFAFSCLKLDDIKDFFNFSNVHSILANNMQALLELQLQLPSGQNLWKALLYLKEICSANFSFEFIFATYEDENNFGAEVSLDSYNSDKKTFPLK